jgi:glucose/arabinose dehydrogenase
VAVLAAALPVRGQPIQVATVLTGLEIPWALAFAPDGRLFITERPGRIRVATNGRLAAEPIAELAVTHVGEAGLMGLALDPDFGRTGHLYICYTARRQGASVNRVTRLTLRGSRAVDERALLDDLPAANIHDGCRVKFGPDGKLYVTTGDAAHPQASQQPEVLSGKILRINADGSIPADNPFRGSPVWSLGHRNPQGLAWDAGGRLWASEHGPGAHDEINLILPGRNYGWPEIQGGTRRAGMVAPVLHSGNDTWAPSGLAFLGDSLYVAGLRGYRLLKVTLAADGRVTGSTSLLADAYGRLRDVVVGPDGALYVATSNRDGRGVPTGDDDRVLRVVP